MLQLCRSKNKLPIFVVNRRPVRKGRKIASDKSAFPSYMLLYGFYMVAFAIITIKKTLVQQTTSLDAATADDHAV